MNDPMAEFDPNDSPDSPFHDDLLLALQAVDGDIARLQALEARAHTLLVEHRVAARWDALGAALRALVP